jgi:hypothetical protein
VLPSSRSVVLQKSKLENLKIVSKMLFVLLVLPLKMASLLEVVQPFSTLHIKLKTLREITLTRMSVLVSFGKHAESQQRLFARMQALKVQSLLTNFLSLTIVKEDSMPLRASMLT